MSLATRCNACGTIFRVVQDQLKVSDGWVRCGRCDTVFDALDSMVDPDAIGMIDGVSDGRSESPASVSPSGDTTAASVDFQPLLRRTDDGINADAQSGIDHSPAIDELADDPAVELESDEPPHEVAPASNADGNGRADAPDAVPEAVGSGPPESVAAQAQPGATPIAPTAAMAGSRTVPPVTPAFLLRAERNARWRNPAMRAALIGSSVILLFILVLQVIVHRRDAIAAQSPLAADWLQGACARWNCKIEPPRSIREVTIENSALAKLAGQPKAVKLSLTMRNRSGGDLVMPAVELSLTDFEGKLIARRALMPGDFQIDPPILAGASELPLQLIVSAGEHRIAGYTVELFYP